jgi:hypothetical protein
MVREIFVTNACALDRLEVVRPHWNHPHARVLHLSSALSLPYSLDGVEEKRFPSKSGLRQIQPTSGVVKLEIAAACHRFWRTSAIDTARALRQFLSRLIRPAGCTLSGNGERIEPYRPSLCPSDRVSNATT